MISQIETIRKIRVFLIAAVSDLSLEELNKIPTGFNNNIVWNLGHLVASQQGLCYVRAGLSPSAGEDFMASYKSGSIPEKFIQKEELEMIKGLLLTTLDQFEADYTNNAFPHYHAWTTRYGVQLTTIDDALNFLPFHEGLHMGNITALKRLVKK